MVFRFGNLCHEIPPRASSEDGNDFSGWWFGDRVGGTQAGLGLEKNPNPL